MLRNLAAALALMVLTQTALGLGLGTLKQSSALNEPFDGRVEILGANARDAESITVKLADESQFERAGVLRTAPLLHLRFKVVDGGAKDYIHITSHDAIREPFLNFLLELNWANGRVVREYTVLLDPPLYDPVRPRARTEAVTTPAPAPAPEPEVVVAPAPAPAPAPAESAPMVTVEVAEPPEPVAAPAYESGSTLGTVQTNDTLWSLASQNLPDSSVSVQQMMLALLRANPEAFGDGNINILKRGAVLRTPDQDELHALDRSAALAEVRRQHQLWNDYRGTAVESVAEAPLSIDEEEPMEAVAEEPVAEDPVAEEPVVEEPVVEETPTIEDTTEDAVAAAEDDSDARLELVAPGSDDDEMGAGDGTTGDADVTLTREELDAQMQANVELQARISEADEIIDLMRRQVDIKDDELAALQTRLAELGIETPADLMPDAGVDDAGADEMAGDEIVTEDDMAYEGPSGPIVDEEHVVMVPSDDVEEIDITIGEPDTGADGGADDEDIDIGTAAGDGDGAVPMDDGGGDGGGGGSLLSGLIPAHIANMVPGGAMTVLGIAGAVLLAILVGLFKLIGGGREETAEAVGIETVADDDDTALTEFAEDDEPITETREGEEDATVGADQDTVEAEIFDDQATAPDLQATAPEMQATTPDMQATIEATADELAGPAGAVETEDDPLEEVNVYLAYERFDQAEELVRTVIGEHPDEHKYKLRLLEVYYSSNDKVAYEEAARELHEAVAEDDTLWESAVAMWAEMSPERALFEEGASAEEAAPAEEDAASAFVDITADAEGDEAGAKTLSMAPGSDSVLESTQVGLPPIGDEDEDEGALDFDLGDDTGSGSTDEVLDLTATTDDGGMLDLTGGAEDGPAAADGDEIFDLTAAADDGALDLAETTDDDVLDLTAATDDDVLDLTATTDDSELDLAETTNDNLLDLTATTDASAVEELDFTLDEEPSDSGDVLDIGADTSDLAGSDNLLDVTTPELGGDHDLLDVTKTGNLGSDEPEDILNVTSPGLVSDEEPSADDDVLDISGDGSSIDFDISDTVAPAFDNDGAEDDTDGVFDITAGTPEEVVEGGDDVLDFDIGGLADDDDVTAEFAPSDDGLDITGGADAEAAIEADAREMLEDSLELDIPETQEDSIETVEMEAIPLADTRDQAEEDTGPIGADTVPVAGDGEVDAAADFDLSLQSAELDELSIGSDTIGDEEAPASDDESEIEFDLALQDTTEMDSLVIDDTLELPKTREPDETLDDLTKSMEESMAELDIDEEELDLGDDGELDLSLADTTGSLDLDLDSSAGASEEAPSLEFDLDDLDISEMDQADTVVMDMSPAAEPASEKTVIIPPDEAVEVQSDADEIDTKLNLAKAYIELGDNDGARSILDEVARDGSEGQQGEAQRLIDQIG